MEALQEPQVLLWIDGDSCPKNLRAILLRAIVRTGIPATFVADRSLADVKSAIEAHTATLRQAYRSQAEGDIDPATVKAVRSPIRMVVVSTGADSADDYIVEHAEQGTLAVTHDVPLSARLAQKGLVVLDERGGIFSSENVMERLSLRNMMTDLREMGIYAERPKGIGPAETQAFSNALDKQLLQLLRRFGR